MIEAELHTVPEGGQEYVPVARVRVEDDGTSQVWDPESLFPFSLHVLVPGELGSSSPRKVTFEEDPQLWVRQLSTVLRTGYLVPVITHDDAVPAHG